MTRARVDWQMAKHGMYLDCPWNEDFLTEMKRVVPPDEREWDNQRKRWWISDAWIDEVDNLIFTYFETSSTGRDA